MAAAEFAAEGARAAHSALLGMVEADGAVLCIDGRQVVVGETPPPGALAPLIAELAARSGADSKPWCTDRLPLLAELPFGSDPGFVAATGAMFQPLPGYAENYVLWLRGERAATVRWAGRTEAPPDEALTPLQPRASFAEWLEEVRGRSVPWRAEELEIAAEFAQCVPELLVNRAQNRLMRLALHDPLTGLPNRLYLIDRLEQMSGAAESAAVFFVDLDGFKKVNDSFGHAAGDELLTMVARRLARLLRPCDFVARIGGDEFVVVAIGLSAPDAAAVGQRVVDAFREPMELQGRVERFVSLSVGVALLDAGTTPKRGAPARGFRDVQGQARRTRSARRFRRDAARRSRSAAGGNRGAEDSNRSRRDRAVLPTGIRHIRGNAPPARFRGVGALASSRAGPPPAERLLADRRGGRTYRRDGLVDPHAGGSRARGLAKPRTVGGGQSLCRATRRTTFRRRRADAPRRPRPRSGTAHSGSDGKRDDADGRAVAAGPQHLERRRSADCYRRFRHGLLLADLCARPARRHPEDRPLFRPPGCLGTGRT